MRRQALKITVSALTRGRPQMLSALLKSWADMQVPEGCEVTCLIVENDSAPRSQAVVAAHDPLSNGLTLTYALEPEEGIPFGRNRAAREAIAAESDLLVFVDDDEVVAEDWLVRLVDGYHRSSAVLLGAPLRVAEPSEPLSTTERLVHGGLVIKYREKETLAARRASDPSGRGFTVATNNWLGETRLFSEHGFWFDETMRYTGGTDSKFSAEVRAAGLPVGWVEDAFVYEDIPKSRLTLRYQFSRARDQSCTNFHRKLETQPAARWMVLLSLPAKAITLLIIALGVPFRPTRLLKLVQKTGTVSGRVAAALGYRSDLYRTITGS